MDYSLDYWISPVPMSLAELAGNIVLVDSFMVGTFVNGVGRPQVMETPGSEISYGESRLGSEEALSE